MTATEMIDTFRKRVDDQLDSDLELELVNDAINEVEMLKDWEILKKETTYTITQGDSYQNTQALPTRFLMDLRVWEDDDIIWDKVSFEDRYERVNTTNAYFIDYANDVIGFAGENLAANTIYLYYTEYSADLTINDTWVFPSWCHKVIPYKMAEIYYAIDSGEKARAWDDRWGSYVERIMNRMMTWDDRLKTRNRKNRINHNREDSLNLPVYRRQP